jgi:hypothetical protein
LQGVIDVQYSVLIRSTNSACEMLGLDPPLRAARGAAKKPCSGRAMLHNSSCCCTTAPRWYMDMWQLSGCQTSADLRFERHPLPAAHGLTANESLTQ